MQIGPQRPVNPDAIVAPQGYRVEALITGLTFPSAISFGPGGALLFGLGTRTNSGVVGLDNVARGWVDRNPDWADVPGTDLRLDGVNYVTTQSGAGGTLRQATGGFRPFGRRGDPGEVVRGSQR